MTNDYCGTCGRLLGFKDDLMWEKRCVMHGYVPEIDRISKEDADYLDLELKAGCGDQI